MPRGTGRRWVVAGLGAVVVATVSLGVHVASARPVAPAANAPLAVAPESPADAATLSEEMADLLRRELEAETELATAASQVDAHLEGTPTAIRVLELEQELRHLRAARAWTEERAAHIPPPPAAPSIRAH